LCNIIPDLMNYNIILIYIGIVFYSGVFELGRRGMDASC